MTEHTSNNSDAKHATNKEQDYTPLAKRFLWADSKHSVEKVILGLSILCGLLFLLDFIIHRHTYVPGEGFPGFYAIVGFLAFTLIVLSASQLRKIILRNEQYYSPHAVDAEHYPEAGLERLEHGEKAKAVDRDATKTGGSE